MSRIFSGLRCILVGITSNQRNIIARNIVGEGGIVMEISKAPFIPSKGSNQEVPNSLCTHVVSGKNELTTEFLNKALNSSPELYKDVPIVHTNWIKDCMIQKAKISEKIYLVKVIEEQKTTVSPSRGRKRDIQTNINSVNDGSNITIEEVSVEPMTKKAKINDYFTPLNSTSTSTSHLTTTSSSTQTTSSSSLSSNNITVAVLSTTISSHKDNTLITPITSTIITPKIANISKGFKDIFNSTITSAPLQKYRHIPMFTPRQINITKILDDSNWYEFPSFMYKFHPLSQIQYRPSSSFSLESVDVLESEEEYKGQSAESTCASIPSSSTQRIPRQIKYIGFDLDDTIITTKSGNSFPINEDDWKLKSLYIIETLQQYYQQKYSIVFITNQQGIKIDVLCIIGDDMYRKPCTGAWDVLQVFRHYQIRQHYHKGNTDDDMYAYFIHNQSTINTDTSAVDSTSTYNNNNNDNNVMSSSGTFSIPIEHDKSTSLCTMTMFVGDAAGRPRQGIVPADFSDSDIKLAYNIGCQFQVPEVFFDKQSHPPILTKNNRLSTLRPISKTQMDKIWSQILLRSSIDNSTITAISTTSEIVMFVGPACTGKTFYAQKLVEYGYYYVNTLTLGSLPKGLNIATQYLQGNTENGVDQVQGRRIVIDDIHLTIESRQRWIALARKFNIPIRVIVMTCPEDIASILHKIRYFSPLTPEIDRRGIRASTLSKQYRELQNPSTREGFSRVDTLPFYLTLPSLSQTSDSTIANITNTEYNSNNSSSSSSDIIEEGNGTDMKMSFDELLTLRLYDSFIK